MLIMRFHKLIQSKVVWIIFVSIIVVSFVALQVASDSSPDPAAARLEQPVARINGKEISFLELDITRRLIGLQTRNRMEPELLDDLALNHLAMVEYARSLGITVGKEFAASQFALNFTDEDGKLDEDALNRFRQNIRGTRISEPDYIEFIRQQIVVDQLRNVMAGSILVPEFEVDRWASLQTDEFVVAYSPLGPEILTEEIEVTDEEVETFFQENSERFMLPEERIVRYITVTADSHTAQMDPPTEEEARAAYLSEPEAYLRTAESQDEDGTESTKTEPVPFEEVREQILADLAAERALEAAESVAMNLAIRMTPRRGRSAEAFDAVAEDAGLDITTTKPFSQRSPLEGPANARSFKQAAFELDFSEFGQRAGPVQVGEQFVIMELVEVLPPRVPALEEVTEQVTQAAIQLKRREALITQVDVVADKIREAVTEGRPFEEAARELDLNVLTSDPISLMTLDPRTSMIPNELIRELPAHQAGDVIGPVRSQFGGFFLASVKERIPQPEAKKEAQSETRQMLASQIHFQGMFSRFQEEVIQPMIEKL